MEINYNEPIEKENLDMDAYNAKFEFVDRIMSKDSRKVKVGEMQRIYNDITMFCYAFFRLNNEPLKLYPYQDMILNDNHRNKIFRAARQIGKSLALDVKAAYNLCIPHGKNHNECIISNSLPQATFQMKRVKDLLDKSTIKGIDRTDDSNSVLSVNVYGEDGKETSKNLLVVVPCTEGSLGYDFHEVNLDEFEYYDKDIEYFYQRIIEPTTFHTKGKITIFSNPNGSDNIVAQFENELGSDGNKFWHTYIFNYLDCPNNTQKEWDDHKTRKSRIDFESTVAAIRSISDRNYFTSDEIENSYDFKMDSSTVMYGKQPFFFLDVGAKHDQSVLTGGYIERDEDDDFNHLYIPIIHIYPKGYPLTRVVGVDVDNSDGWHIEKTVKEYIEEYSKKGIIPIFGYDITGNEGMNPLFRSLNIAANDVIFSGPSKSGYYQRFKYFMEKNLIHRCESKDWAKQASQLIATKSIRGYLLINAASQQRKGGKAEDTKLKRIPDDCMDSTAGLINLADPQDYIEPSLTII